MKTILIICALLLCMCARKKCLDKSGIIQLLSYATISSPIDTTDSVDVSFQKYVEKGCFEDVPANWVKIALGK